jgi:hypothetical protein
VRHDRIVEEWRRVMEEVTTVACKMCGVEITVSRAATRSPKQLDSELPMGWDLREERDEATGKLVVVVYCPDHADV